MVLRMGVVGAGNRGQVNASAFGAVEDVQIAAIADIDETAANALADEYDAESYSDHASMLDGADLDAICVNVHNNLHRPITIDAAEAGCHVFCEKPMAATYTDAAAMAAAADAAGVELGVQNLELFTEETTAAKRLLDAGKLGDPYFARALYARRRGRPYVDGYGTPSFVRSDTAGGGPVLDIGTYVIGRMLYLMGNPSVTRVSGSCFEHTADAYDEDLTGDNAALYRDRLAESGHDVEDMGLGMVSLENGAVLSVLAAWHAFMEADPDLLVGSKGGLRFDPLEYYTTTADYEATVSLDVDGYERRHALIESETGYDGSGGENQHEHWIASIRGEAEEPIPTGEIALNSMRVMEGIYLANEASEELTAEEIEEHSTSTAVEL